MIKSNNLTFNAQFNFCYPQPFQVFQFLENLKTKLSKILFFYQEPFALSRTATFVALSTARLSPWRDGQLSRFFRRGNQNLSIFFVAAVFSAAAIPFWRGGQLSGLFSGVNQNLSIFFSAVDFTVSPSSVRDRQASVLFSGVNKIFWIFLTATTFVARRLPRGAE